jgi:hypothetical protein
MNDNGRPEFPEEQYQKWLDEMSPFLKLGNTLYHAIEKADLTKHKDTIYRKFRLNDWFCEKIEAFQRYPGEIVNSIFTRLIISIDEKVKQGSPISDEDWRNLRFFAEKHRSCQPFFVTRTETAHVEPDKVSKILDALEYSDYDDLGHKAKEQMDKLNETSQ